MFYYKNDIETSAKDTDIWALYEDVSKWPDWDVTMEKVELHDGFATGTKGLMQMKGAPPLSFELQDVTQGSRFKVIAEMGEISVVMDHLLDTSSGKVMLTHTVEIQGGNENQIQGIGNGISQAIPASMERLISLAKGE